MVNKSKMYLWWFYLSYVYILRVILCITFDITDYIANIKTKAADLTA